MQITIIGGGFSGLSVAYYLQKHGFQVRLFEKQSLGGLLGTIPSQYGLTEKAANGIMADETFINLCQEIKVPPVFAEVQSKKRYIHRADLKSKVSRWPFNFKESLKVLVKGFFLLLMFKLRKEKLRPRAEQSLKNWIDDFLGEEVSINLAQPAINGIYASNIQTLSAKLILKRLFQNTARKKSLGLVSFAGGMQELIDGLKNYLELKGVKLIKEEISEVQFHSLQKAGPIILAVPANQIEKIIPDLPKDIKRHLQQIEYRPLITATLFFATNNFIKEGFGCLFTESSKSKALGVLWNKFIFKTRGPYHSETWILGGDKSPDLILESDQKIQNYLLAERKRLFDRQDDLLDFKVTKWTNGLPSYSVAATQSIEYLSSQPLQESKIFFHGNYLGGIGLAQICKQSEFLAKSMKDKFKTSTRLALP